MSYLQHHPRKIERIDLPGESDFLARLPGMIKLGIFGAVCVAGVLAGGFQTLRGVLAGLFLAWAWRTR